MAEACVRTAEHKVVGEVGHGNSVIGAATAELVPVLVDLLAVLTKDLQGRDGVRHVEAVGEYDGVRLYELAIFSDDAFWYKSCNGAVGQVDIWLIEDGKVVVVEYSAPAAHFIVGNKLVVVFFRCHLFHIVNRQISSLRAGL